MAITTKSASRGLRPTLVIAEALVDRQAPSQIVDRARKLGFSPSLTTAVVGACCGQQHCPDSQKSASSYSSTPFKAAQT
jgi:hypothetical protein